MAREAMQEITAIVLRHFTPELEHALRTAFEELIGELRGRFAIELEPARSPMSLKVRTVRSRDHHPRSRPDQESSAHLGKIKIGGKGAA